MGYPVVFTALREEYWDWVKERAKPVLATDTRGIVALQDSKPVAAIVFDNWSENACQSHIAIDNPMVLRHGFLEEACYFVFVTAGRGVVIGITPADNARALRFNRRIGFREIYRVRDGFAVGVDYVLQEMRKETCRWLPADRRMAA